MNIIYFTMKKLNENKAFLAMLGFLLVFSCSKDKKEGNGNGKEDPAPTVIKYTLTITKPTGGKLVSKPGNIDCGGEGTVCKVEFNKGTEVTLTATADTGYAPAAWQGACDKTKAGESTCKLSMDANKTAGRAFLARPILAIDRYIGGSITNADKTIDCGSKTDTCEASFDKDSEVTLTATVDTGYVLGDWQGACDETATGQPCKLTMNANQTAGRVFLLDTDEDGDPDITDSDDDGDGTDDVTDVDDDNDGLIEIHNLDMFDHIQYNLAGTSYKTGASIADNRTGAPTAATADCTTVATGVYLCGYELTKDLDFAEGASYAGSSVNAAWRPNAQADAGGSATSPDAALNAGFVGATDFAGLFDGNGYKISNLYSRNTSSSAVKNIGLFARTTATASIRNMGVADAHLYGNERSVNYIGSLVGANYGTIIASSATGGTVNNGGGAFSSTGGLVGYNRRGTIIASSATGGNLNGGAGSDDNVGGLVGYNNGSIGASYATGAANGSVGSDDNVGGLVGYNNGSIGASYATGAVNGDAGDDYVGGLIGVNSVPEGFGSVLASYATGDVDGGGGSDQVGILIGQNLYRGVRGTVTASYGFGSKSGGSGSDHHDGTDKPDGVTSANGLTATNVDAKWNDAAEKTLNAWDFGTASQAPALRYADYDGDGGVDYCDMFPKAVPGTNIPLICGKSLLPGQGR